MENQRFNSIASSIQEHDDKLDSATIKSVLTALSRRWNNISKMNVMADIHAIQSETNEQRK